MATSNKTETSIFIPMNFLAINNVIVHEYLQSHMQLRAARSLCTIPFAERYFMPSAI